MADASAPGQWPPVEELVPHSGPMLLLSRVVDHDATGTRCEVDLGEQQLFRRPDGRIPGWVAIEYMAQGIAAHAGLAGRRTGERPRIGYLLGTRRLQLAEPSLPGDGLLEVRVSPLRGRPEAGAMTFACQLIDREGPSGFERVLAEGDVSVAIERGPGRPIGVLS